ncbi:hypothetical protein AMTR_s00202p00031830 [Amborella trichopoda]|uniref:Uncharacterized protein n=1 Tax=Amborella trichopoda TaxID=13333 RepID=W1NN57_AMBTC|nr:hypothetical protein AMTR_s00202p00031830 [Amborella trichopoda]
MRAGTRAVSPYVQALVRALPSCGLSVRSLPSCELSVRAYTPASPLCVQPLLHALLCVRALPAYAATRAGTPYMRGYSCGLSLHTHFSCWFSPRVVLVQALPACSIRAGPPYVQLLVRALSPCMRLLVRSISPYVRALVRALSPCVRALVCALSPFVRALVRAPRSCGLPVREGTRAGSTSVRALVQARHA